MSNSLEEVLPVSTNASLQHEQYKILELPKWRDVLFSGVPRLNSATQPPVVVVEKKVK